MNKFDILNCSNIQQYTHDTYTIAKYLQLQGFWAKHLPSHEQDIVEAALESSEAWYQFYQLETVGIQTKKTRKKEA